MHAGEKGGARYLIRTIRSHRRRKHDGTFDAQFNKRAGSRARRIKRPEQINIKQRFNLLCREIQRGFMVRSARVGDHAVEGPSLGNDLVDCGRDGRFVGYVGGYGEEAVWVAG